MYVTLCKLLGSRYLSWVHGELMIIVYVGLVPFSILTAYTRRTTSSRWWFQIHRAVNVSSPAKRMCLKGLSLSIAEMERWALCADAKHLEGRCSELVQEACSLWVSIRYAAHLQVFACLFTASPCCAASGLAPAAGIGWHQVLGPEDEQPEGGAPGIGARLRGHLAADSHWRAGTHLPLVTC